MQNIKNHFWSIIFSLLIFSALAISIASRSKTENKQDLTKKCLIVSDIHFNPLYGSSDTGLRRKLTRESFEQWKAYFEGFAPQTAINSSLLYMDANYGILRSAIANMKKRLPHPAFIVIAGDFIWHGAKPADSIIKRKSIQFIAYLFKENFPGTTIVPAMGNNDTYGNDYAAQDAKFLYDFADAWEPALPKSSADSLKAKGYYTCSKDGLKLIVINSLLLNAGSHNPGARAMLNWLHAQLADARTKNVWIIMHIPPGLNVYSGSNFWNAGYTKTFIGDVVEYSSKVKFSIASHTHFNDFRVFYNTDLKPAPVAFMRVVPSICSNHGNNPSFEIAEFNEVTGSVMHETNYYLNLMAITKDKTVTQAEWNDIINLQSTLKLDKINATDLSKFIDHARTDKTGQFIDAYTKLYTVGTQIDESIRVGRTNYLKYLKADSLK